MKRLLVAGLLFCSVWNVAAKDGSGSVTISGELKQWHNVTLTLDGPFAKETSKPGSGLNFQHLAKRGQV
jgi:hypothetical protein